MLRLGCERRPREGLSAQTQIRSVTGAAPWLWFRFRYGDYNQHTISVVNGTGFPVGWTVDTLGWKGTSGGITTQTVLNRVLGSLGPGEIVLMHCGSNPDDHSTLDADALPAVIRAPLTWWFPQAEVPALAPGRLY
jgi:peptidoglycan/xylan/chitin deacetylase (PgdA/CDA1 family)